MKRRLPHKATAVFSSGFLHKKGERNKDMKKPFSLTSFKEQVFPQNMLVLEIALDLSGSMEEFIEARNVRKIDVLKQAVQDLFTAIEKDPIMKRSVAIGFTGFSSHITNLRDNQTLYENSELPNIGNADGATKLGEGFIEAVQKIERAQTRWQGKTNTLPPVILIMSDGLANGSKIALYRAKALAGRYNVVPVAIGDEAESVLKDFGNPLKISDLQIKELFVGIASATASSLTTASTEAFQNLIEAAISWSQIGLQS
jgi:uncharacterized protein YegL